MPEPVTAIIAGGTALASAGIGAVGASKAAKSQEKAGKKAAKLQKEALAQQIALSKPYVEAGTNAMAQYQKLAPYQPFGMPQFEADPGYQFRMSEGLKALERSASARGLLQSGGTLKDITRFGQDLASQEYQNAFQRYLAQREASMEPYRYLTGVGQAAASGQAANVGESGRILANLATQRGNVQAAQTMGTANAFQSALGTIGSGVTSYMADQPYVNYLRSITPATSGVGSTTYQA